MILVFIINYDFILYINNGKTFYFGLLHRVFFFFFPILALSQVCFLTLFSLNCSPFSHMKLNINNKKILLGRVFYTIPRLNFHLLGDEVLIENAWFIWNELMCNIVIKIFFIFITKQFMFSAEKSECKAKRI